MTELEGNGGDGGGSNIKDNNDVENGEEEIPIVSDPDVLLRYGICKVPLPDKFDALMWAKELSQITPEIMLGQGESDYAFYRNIMEEPDFPFDYLLFGNNNNNNKNTSSSEVSNNSLVGSSTTIGRAIINHFPIQDLQKEIRLDDAFCVHYSMDQDDTSGAKHMDPSDITINMCLEKSDNTKGSHVLFYGTNVLENSNNSYNSTTDRTEEEVDTTHQHKSQTLTSSDDINTVPKKFYVVQDPGYATIHYGDHLHETTTLHDGRRTNIIMTYCYTDPTRSDVATRSCY